MTTESFSPLSYAIRYSAYDGPSKCYFVCIFKFAANGYTAGDGTDFQVGSLQSFCNIKSCCISFHSSRQRKNNFPGTGSLYTFVQGFYVQVTGPNSIYG